MCYRLINLAYQLFKPSPSLPINTNHKKNNRKHKIREIFSWQAQDAVVWLGRKEGKIC